MAYRRKKIYRKRTTYKRPYKRTPTAAKAVRMVRTLARQVKPELKYFDMLIDQRALHTGHINYFLPEIPQGVDEGQRIGNKIMPTTLKIDGYFQKSSANANPTNMIRVILFRVRIDNNRLFSVSGNPSTPNAILTDLQPPLLATAPYHWNNRKRFKILYDKRYLLSDGTVETRSLKWTFRLHGQTTYVNSGFGVEDNGLYLLIISDQENEPPIVRFNARVTFTDA